MGIRHAKAQEKIDRKIKKEKEKEKDQREREREAVYARKSFISKSINLNTVCIKV